MRHRIITCVLALFCCCGLARADGRPAVSEETLFRLPLSGGREIAVVRGPAVDVSLLRGLVSDLVFQQTAALYPIRAELRSPALPPQVFWTYLEREPTAASQKGFAVLDAAVAPDQLILATAEGGGILIWRIELCGGSQAAWLHGGDWSQIAAVEPLDGSMVRVKLGFTDDGKRQAADRPGHRPAGQQPTANGL